MAQYMDSLGFHLWEWVSTQLSSVENRSFMVLTLPNFVYWHVGSNHNPIRLAAFPYKKGTLHICPVKHMMSTQEFIWTLCA